MKQLCFLFLVLIGLSCSKKVYRIPSDYLAASLAYSSSTGVINWKDTGAPTFDTLPRLYKPHPMDRIPFTIFNWDRPEENKLSFYNSDGTIFWVDVDSLRFPKSEVLIVGDTVSLRLEIYDTTVYDAKYDDVFGLFPPTITGKGKFGYARRWAYDSGYVIYTITDDYVIQEDGELKISFDPVLRERGDTVPRVFEIGRWPKPEWEDEGGWEHIRDTVSFYYHCPTKTSDDSVYTYGNLDTTQCPGQAIKVQYQVAWIDSVYAKAVVWMVEHGGYVQVNNLKILVRVKQSEIYSSFGRAPEPLFGHIKYRRNEEVEKVIYLFGDRPVKTKYIDKILETYKYK